jgi:hypothetical protein
LASIYIYIYIRGRERELSCKALNNFGKRLATGNHGEKIYRALGIDFATYVVNMQLHEAGREARCKGNYHSSLVSTIVNSSH